MFQYKLHLLCASLLQVHPPLGTRPACDCKSIGDIYLAASSSLLGESSFRTALWHVLGAPCRGRQRSTDYCGYRLSMVRLCGYNM